MIKGFNIIPMCLEKTGNELWGRVNINDNPIIDHADTIDKLKEQLKSLVYIFEGIQVDNFEIETTNVQAG
ncbi:MAG: hypothetical protein ACJ75B_05600 [Flavisolibacter sp.]